MNSRERVLKTIEHKETDRVPADILYLVGYKCFYFVTEKEKGLC